MNEDRQRLLNEIGITKMESELGIYDWNEISKYVILSEEFIRTFQKKLSWTSICTKQRLSEDFIREFKNKIYWHSLSRYQTLSEDFIREFKDDVEWVPISKYQQLSDDFLVEFKRKIDWGDYFRSQKASFAIIKKFILNSDVEKLSYFESSHLNSEQKEVIGKMLELKYMFTK